MPGLGQTRKARGGGSLPLDPGLWMPCSYSPAWHRPKTRVSPPRSLCSAAFRAAPVSAGFPAQGPRCALQPPCAPLTAVRSLEDAPLPAVPGAGPEPSRAGAGGSGREGAAEEAGLGSAPLSPPTGVSHLPYIQTRGRWRWRTMRKHPWRERSPQLINSDPRPRPASQVVVPKPTLSDHRSLINIPCHKFGPKPIHSV